MIKAAEHIFEYKCGETGRVELHCSPSSDTAKVSVLAENKLILKGVYLVLLLPTYTTSVSQNVGK